MQPTKDKERYSETADGYQPSFNDLVLVAETLGENPNLMYAPESLMNFHRNTYRQPVPRRMFTSHVTRQLFRLIRITEETNEGSRQYL